MIVNLRLCYIKKCSFCGVGELIKKGKRRGVQRYQCTNCGKNFQSKRRKEKLQNKLWNEYIAGKQTAGQLAIKYKQSRKWILKQLKKVSVPASEAGKKKEIIVVADATFFSWSEGILIFREPNLKINLIWKKINTESPGSYEQLKLELERQGYVIKGVVLDGKRGVREVFRGIPVQKCHFHQIATTIHYLTKRPLLDASKELLQIAYQLTKRNELEFTNLLVNWQAKWGKFLKEKSYGFDGHWQYTHRRTRAAFRSLKTNLPYLFTYQKYPELDLPNTTNSLDGFNTTIKQLIGLHRGVNHEKRYTMICQILKK